MFRLMQKFWKSDREMLQDSDGKSYMVQKGYKALVQRAERGNERAQFEIVELYNSDAGYIPADLFKWTKHLADIKKTEKLLIQLAELYENGIGTSANPSKALNCYEMAYNIAASQCAYPPSPTEKEHLLAIRMLIKEVRKKI